MGKSKNESLYSCYNIEIKSIIVRERIQSIWSCHSNREYSFFVYVENWDATEYCAEVRRLTFSFKNIRMERFRK